MFNTATSAGDSAGAGVIQVNNLKEGQEIQPDGITATVQTGFPRLQEDATKHP